MGDERLGGGVHAVGTIGRLARVRGSFAVLAHVRLLLVRSQPCHTHKTPVPIAL